MGDVFLDRTALADRVSELSAEISSRPPDDDLVVVCVLTGSIVFAADLCRSLTVPHSTSFVALEGYDGRRGGPPNSVRVLLDLDQTISERDVLIVDDIVDTGLTLNHLRKLIAARRPRSLEMCVLLDRPCRRLIDDLPLRYVGFTVPDELFVGYGLGLHGRVRHLPDLHLVEREPMRPATTDDTQAVAGVS